MAFVCRRCEHITPALYRVTSKHRGAVLLDMAVCRSCAWLAKRLGLAVVKLKSARPSQKSLQAVPERKLQSARLATPI